MKEASRYAYLSQRGKNRALSLLILVLIVVLDYISKRWVVNHLMVAAHTTASFPFGGIDLFHCLGIDGCIHYVCNHGAAWGWGSQFQIPLVLCRGVILAVLCQTFFTSSPQLRSSLPLACIIAGGVGNLLDYFLYGHVVDMIHLIFWGYSYPVFNLADTAIVLGVIGFIFFYNQASRSEHASS
ncbi:MAG: signal peptidase II [Candidatus Rhabdochlamydia sp.]